MAYTDTSAVSVDQVAFDRLAYFALRSELLFDQAADVQPTAQAMPGSGVTFTIFNDLSAATSTSNFHPVGNDRCDCGRSVGFAGHRHSR